MIRHKIKEFFGGSYIGAIGVWVMLSYVNWIIWKIIFITFWTVCHWIDLWIAK